jgi:hypothetical protein
LITDTKKNKMGTISFNGKFKGMRKSQEFIVYPIHGGQDASRVTIQSDTRIGIVNLNTGTILMSPSIPSGAYNPHLALARPLDMLSGEELLLLKSNILSTAKGAAGSNGVVFTDNSGALDVFAGT